MGKYTVVTAITGGRDELKEQPEQKGVRYVCFTDDMTRDPKGWELLPACDKFDPFMNAKMHKVLIHKYIDSEVTLWIDGSVVILKDVKAMADLFLKNKDIAVYNFSSWINGKVATIDEAFEECLKQKKDKLERIEEQRANNDYPAITPIVCTILFRRNTDKMKVLNQNWWSEICRYSVRDQLSFPYVFKDYELIKGNIRDNFDIIQHNEN